MHAAAVGGSTCRSSRPAPRQLSSKTLTSVSQRRITAYHVSFRFLGPRWTPPGALVASVYERMHGAFVTTLRRSVLISPDSSPDIDDSI